MLMRMLRRAVVSLMVLCICLLGLALSGYGFWRLQRELEPLQQQRQRSSGCRGGESEKGRGRGRGKGGGERERKGGAVSDEDDDGDDDGEEKEGGEERLLLSVIIPARNEARVIGGTMRRLEQCCGRGRRALGEEQKKRVEVVIVDAGCTDNTLEVVKASLASIPVTFVSASPSAGRGPALNAGVKAARGSTLLFLHADTLVPKAFDDMVRDALEGRPDMPTLLASFEFGVDRSNALARGEDLPAGLGIMQWAANVRSSLFLLPYGDQGLAMKRELLAEIGYFPNQPIMEDFEVVTRLRRRAMAGEGSVKTIPVPALCSPRRWQQNGVFMNTLLNQVFVILYVYFGASPAAVYSWYYALSPRITRWCRF